MQKVSTVVKELENKVQALEEKNKELEMKVIRLKEE